MQVQSLHSKEKSWQHDRANTTTNQALYKKGRLSYNIPCGAANGRCVGDESTYAGFAGVGAPIKLPHFCFPCYYSRNLHTLQALLQTPPIGRYIYKKLKDYPLTAGGQMIKVG